MTLTIHQTRQALQIGTRTVTPPRKPPNPHGLGLPRRPEGWCLIHDCHAAHLPGDALCPGHRFRLSRGMA